MFAEAAAQTTNSAAKVIPYLSLACRPAESSNLMMKCRNPAPGMLLTLTDVKELLHKSSALFSISHFSLYTTQTETELSNACTLRKKLSDLTTNTKCLQEIFFF